MPKFKIETLDINFEYQEKLLKSVEQGIKETKRKLNDTEIMITLEPNKSDAQEWQRWEKALDNVIHRPTNLNFPNLSRMKKEHEMKKLSQLEASRRSKMASRDAAALQAQRIMAKQAQNMQKKIIEGKCKFGSSIEGEQIGVVNHYKGTNTYEVSGKRVLRRKDGRNHMVDPENPDLPPWIGPMYYFDAQQSHLEQTKKSDRYFQLPFESKREKQRSTAIVERENITRRRHELRSAAAEHREHHGELQGEESGHYHSPVDGGSPTNFHRTFADIKASIEREDRGEEDPDWEEVYSPVGDEHSLSSRKSSSRRLLKDDSAVFSAVGGSTNQSSFVSPADSLQASAVNTARQPSMHVTYSPQLVDDNVLGGGGTASPPRTGGTAMASSKPPALTSSASVGSLATSFASSSTTTTKRSQARSKSIGMDPHLAQQRHRVVLDPLLTHHAYALKILQSDPSVQQAASYGQQASLNPHLQLYQQQRHLPNRCKDYTFHALTNQKPLVLDNFNMENSVASVAQRMQQQQQQQQQQQSMATTLSAASELNPPLSGPNSRAGTANSSMGTSQLKFSSDIFKKPTVEYRTADELWKEAKVKFNASHLVPDPFGNVGGTTTTTTAATATNGNGGNSSNRNARGSISVPRRRRYDSITPILREGSEAAESMELTMQLLTNSRATTAHRSSRPYGMLASLELFSASQQQPQGSFSPSSKPASPEGGAGAAMVAPLSRGHTPLPRHMSPPRSSPLRESSTGTLDNEFGDELPPMDDFPMSSTELLASTSPVGHLIDDFMASHHVHRSRDFNAFSSKRRERKPLDTNRTGQMKSRYRSKARGMSPTKSANGEDTWDAASVLQEIANMKGLLLEEDPAEVYPALIEANRDRDIDHIVLR